MRPALIVQRNRVWRSGAFLAEFGQTGSGPPTWVSPQEQAPEPPTILAHKCPSPAEIPNGPRSRLWAGGPARLRGARENTLPRQTKSGNLYRADPPHPFRARELTNATQIGRYLARQIWPDSAKFGRPFGKSRPNLGELWSNRVQLRLHRPNLAKVWPIWAQIWPRITKLCRFGPT